MPTLLLGNTDSSRDCRPDDCSEDFSWEPGGGGGSGGFSAEAVGAVAEVLPPPPVVDDGVSAAEAVALPESAAPAGVGRDSSA